MNHNLYLSFFFYFIVVSFSIGKHIFKLENLIKIKIFLNNEFTLKEANKHSFNE